MKPPLPASRMVWPSGDAVAARFIARQPARAAAILDGHGLAEPRGERPGLHAPGDVLAAAARDGDNQADGTAREGLPERRPCQGQERTGEKCATVHEVLCRQRCSLPPVAEQGEALSPR
jgi:hypothetical protein